jgi:formylglycine-generating enzyme required for sulfatase activity
MHALRLGDVSLELVPIPAGSFRMGSTKGLELETPVRIVHIKIPFLLGRFPVTQAQWLAVMGENPSEFRDSQDAGQLPVENVSWDRAIEFCARSSAASGCVTRLPSEAEWEYACRAGTQTEYFFGDDESLLDDYAWFHNNSQERTHSVGSKQANPWGLEEMIGNVWEWCQDVWHSDYQNAPATGQAWLEGEERQPRRSLRGGAFNFDGFRCRSAYRSREWKHFATNHFGLRVAVEEAVLPQ